MDQIIPGHELGVRPSLIPTLINYFQGRQMFVKWHGKHSKSRKLNGGGPQGGTLGILEFLSQSNTNANCVEQDFRWKFVDDLTMLEIINLINIGISCYNSKVQVPNDLDVDKNYIPAENLKTSTYLKSVNEWTINQKMMLNKKKTTNMIINFTNNYQFNTRLNIDGEKIDTVEKTKLLGTIISNDLKLDENTIGLIKKANARICLLRKVASFSPPTQDLKIIYFQYIRSILEQSCVVWHASLTEENSSDLERIQKNSLRNILKNKYINYEQALDELNIDTLEDRREILCLKFAMKAKNNPYIKELFKEKTKNHSMELRNTEQFEVTMAHTKRYQESSIPYMQRLLNTHARGNDLEEAHGKAA